MELQLSKQEKKMRDWENGLMVGLRYHLRRTRSRIIDVAKATGVHESTLQRWLNDKSGVMLYGKETDNLYKVACYFETTVDELLYTKRPTDGLLLFKKKKKVHCEDQLSFDLPSNNSEASGY